jgi:hypothetical protein
MVIDALCIPMELRFRSPSRANGAMPGRVHLPRQRETHARRRPLSLEGSVPPIHERITSIQRALRDGCERCRLTISLSRRTGSIAGQTEEN